MTHRKHTIHLDDDVAWEIARVLSAAVEADEVGSTDAGLASRACRAIEILTDSLRIPLTLGSDVVNESNVKMRLIAVYPETGAVDKRGRSLGPPRWAWAKPTIEESEGAGSDGITVDPECHLLSELRPDWDALAGAPSPTSEDEIGFTSVETDARVVTEEEA